jgi:hypothetical protein
VKIIEQLLPWKKGSPIICAISLIITKVPKVKSRLIAQSGHSGFNLARGG